MLDQNTILSPEIIQENIRTISDLDLQKLSTSELRKIAKQCGVRQLERLGQDKPITISYARKKELIDALETTRTPYLSGTESTEQAGVMSVDEVEESLNNISETDDYAEAMSLVYPIAELVNAQIFSTYPSSHNTRCNKRVQYRKAITARKPASLYRQQIYDLFCNALSNLGVPDIKRKRADENTRIENKQQNKLELQNQPLLDWAKSQVDKPRKWKELGLALALLTGRRLYSEVFCQAAAFSPSPVAGHIQIIGVAKRHDEEYSLRSHTRKGSEQLKQAGDNNTYTIPVLYSPEKILAAFEFLQAAGKRQPTTSGKSVQALIDAREKARSRFSSDVGKVWKRLVKEFYPEHTTDRNLNQPKILREIYVYENTKHITDAKKRELFTGEILLHEKQIIAATTYTSKLAF